MGEAGRFYAESGHDDLVKMLNGHIFQSKCYTDAVKGLDTLDRTTALVNLLETSEGTVGLTWQIAIATFKKKVVGVVIVCEEHPGLVINPQTMAAGIVGFYVEMLKAELTVGLKSKSLVDHMRKVERMKDPEVGIWDCDMLDLREYLHDTTVSYPSAKAAS
jgi:hypothetical protein